MFARKSLFILLTRIIEGITAYISLFFITKYLAPEAYGTVMFAMGFVALFAIISKLGFSYAHVKKISEGKDIGTCLGTFVSIQLILTTLMIIASVAFIIIWTSFNRFETPTHEIIVYIMIAYWAIDSIFYMFTSTFTATKEVACSQVGFLARVITRTILIIIVSFLRLGAIQLAYTYIMGEIAGIIILYAFFRRYPISKPTRPYINTYIKFAFPMMLVVIASLLIQNIDKVLIQYFWSSSEVAYYTSGYRLTAFITTFAASISLLLFPTYSELHTKNKKKEMDELTLKSERYISMLVVPIVFGLSTLANPATRILLNSWMDVVPVIQFLPFYVLFFAYTRPYESHFLGMNKPKLARNHILVMVVVNIILNVILIPTYNVTGAVIATVIAYACGLAYTRIKAYQIMKIKGSICIFYHILAGFVMSRALYIISINFTIDAWYKLLFVSLIGLGIYVAILFILNEFKKDDYTFFMDTLNFKKMFSYIKKELKNGN